MAESKAKLGVYICSGCEIGNCLDIDALVKVAESEFKPAVVRTSDHLCGPEYLQMIKDDIANEGITAPVVCACSIREKSAQFKFGGETMVERVILREHVTWTHESNDENTQELAEDYLRMGCTKAKRVEYPEPMIQEDLSKTVMVVGGGIAGLTSALSAAKAGYKAVIIEKEAELGGWVRKFNKVFPKTPPYNELETSNHAELIEKVEAHSNITIYISTTIKKTGGEPGLYDVTLNTPEGDKEIRIGSIVQATGWRPYNPKKLGHLGFGECDNVITNVMMEEMANNGGFNRPSDGKKVDSVAFIQCAGSRDQDHLPYCSAVCCRASMKQAKYIREANPEAKVFILYKDIRSPGQFELFYQNVQEDEGIFFIKGEVASVKEDADKGVTISLTDTILGEDIEVNADMLVLAAGMVPSTNVDELEEGDASAEEESTLENGKKAAAGAEAGAKILNLNYRQGTDLPTFKYGFPDSHFICFPYETRRTGIYAAGAVRAPMDIAQTVNDAYGATLKAIQVVESISRGEAVHPRAGDSSFPEFFMQRCTQCKRCTEECPFGTLNEDDKGTPMLFSNRCRRCGICMGACPERIITFKNYSVPIIGSMIKELEIPDEEEEKPRVLAFMCENDAIPSLDIAAAHRMQWSPHIRIIPVRCLGSVNTVWIADALSTGYDGILLIGCKYGDDYQCHFVKGSELANTRMENVQEKLKQLVLEDERVQITTVSLNEWKKIPEIFEAFMEDIDEVGPNPYKEF